MILNALEMNKDHSVIFETESKDCIPPAPKRYRPSLTMDAPHPTPGDV